MFLEQQVSIKLCLKDTEDWSNDAEIQLCIKGICYNIRLHFSISCL